MRHESWDAAFTDRLCLGYERQRQKGLGNPEMWANSIHEVFRLENGGFHGCDCDLAGAGSLIQVGQFF